ncbi:MAG: flagellar hook-length control protein FliK [Betaproteobacteria bacterium]|nr:flagellar hook-length control protein FliK [Betaproteobacteria bacterium]
MINVQTLGTLLRTLQSGDVTARAPASLQPLAPTQAVKAISPESTHAQQTGARDASRGQPRAARPAGETPPPTGTAGRPGATAGLAVPAGTAAGMTALLADPDTNPATVVTLAAATADAIASRVEARAPALPLPASAPPTGLPTPGPTGAASLTLSSAAHLVDTLARLPGGEPIRPPLPLASAAAAPEAIARALQHSIVVSGVFYESHLVRWARQRHPEAALRVEPQASWPAASGSAFGAAMPQHDVPASALPEAPASMALPVPEATAGVPDAAPALVRQQLDVLETGQILWRGDLWQGQPATIEIAEDDAGTDPGQAAVWRSRLALTLPGLGPFEARLTLSGQRLHLHLVAADANGATALRDALPELAAALAARALDVAPVRLDHGLRR